MLAPPALKAVNPSATAPVITEGATNLTESGAIIGTLPHTTSISTGLYENYGDGKAQPPEFERLIICFLLTMQRIR
ncbi:hypothetical protein A0H81_02437 [Grifola frondosa]|uniref:Uncharacterized protein n=1 Tax=Grifola frondosa TaxID=5627 RepID=A0A1C7MNM0_GRIFR|nr:hypothetical protein A0H81_02437 [Grifola frondosa]